MGPDNHRAGCRWDADMTVAAHAPGSPGDPRRKEELGSPGNLPRKEEPGSPGKPPGKEEPGSRGPGTDLAGAGLAPPDLIFRSGCWGIRGCGTHRRHSG